MAEARLGENNCLGYENTENVGGCKKLIFILAVMNLCGFFPLPFLRIPSLPNRCLGKSMLGLHCTLFGMG